MALGWRDHYCPGWAPQLNWLGRSIPTRQRPLNACPIATGSAAAGALIGLVEAAGFAGRSGVGRILDRDCRQSKTLSRFPALLLCQKSNVDVVTLVGFACGAIVGTDVRTFPEVSLNVDGFRGTVTVIVFSEPVTVLCLQRTQ